MDNPKIRDIKKKKSNLKQLPFREYTKLKELKNDSVIDKSDKIITSLKKKGLIRIINKGSYSKVYLTQKGVKYF